jgi:hypothetical protein
VQFTEVWTLALFATLILKSLGGSQSKKRLAMTRTGQTTFSILAFCLLSGALYITMTLISPPAPLSIDAPATDFSAGRAMQDLEIIAREPHPMGASEGHAEVRDYLLGEIRALGLEPQVQDTFGIRIDSPGFVRGGFVENILVRLPGTYPDGAILLMAHYDSTPGGPGAGDNGSGVVTLLGILRALHAGPPLRQDVIFFFTDGEEPGTIGARAFIAQHPWYADVKLVINLDTITDAPLTLFRTSAGNGPWIQALASSARRPGFVSLPYHLFPLSDSDLVPFILAGVPGADFVAMGAFLELHTEADRSEVVNPATLQQTGDQLLALLRHLGDQQTLALRAADQTYFPVFGRLVHYPISWALPLVVLAGSCFLGMVIFGFHKRGLTWRGLGMGFFAFLLSLVLNLGIVYLVWQGIQALHPEYEYSSVRPRLSDDYLYAAGFIFLTLAFAAFSIAVARKKVAALDLAAGALVIWFPAAIAATVLVPASSYLFTWSLLSGSFALLLALIVQSRKDAWILSGLGFLTSAILATFLWIPWVYIAFLGPSFPLLLLMVAFAALWMGSMMPILDWITNPKRWLLPAGATLAALGFLLAGHFLIGKASPPPLVNSIGYWLDPDGSEAHWVAFVGGSRKDGRNMTTVQVAFPEEMDERQAGLLVDPVRQPYTDLFQAAPPFSVLTSAAPMLALGGPHLEVIADEWVNSRRVVTIRFTTSMHDRLYIIIPEAPLVAITVPNNERTELGGSNEWRLRFDGMPVEGMEIRFEFSNLGPIRFLLVEEKTGLPSFPGLETQPLPGTMRSPGMFEQGDATDFTAINRNYVIQKISR